MNKDIVNTMHPLGKKNKPVGKKEYDVFKKAILSSLKKKELTHNELLEQVIENLGGKFSGNFGWYTMTVKLDLEARKIIERISSKPQKYKIK